MADETEQLIFEAGIDMSPLGQMAAVVKQTLDELNSKAKQTDDQAKAAIASQGAAITQLKASTEAAILAAKQSVAEEQAKAAAIKTGTLEITKQITEQKLHTEAVKSGLSEQQKVLLERKAETAEIEKQIAELRKKRLEESHEGRAHGEDNRAFATAASKLGGALFGRTAGGLAGAVVGGELIAKGIEAGIESIARFIDRLKEMQEESSKLTLVSDRFNALARGAGTEGPDMLIKMREATEGLVDKLVLAQFGTRALQANIKGFTPDKIVELTGAVVKLAEASGRVNATQAVSMLGSALSRGGQRAAFMLAQITGINRSQLMLANLSPIMNRVERDAASLDHAMAVVLQEAAKLGELPRTMGQAATQLRVLSKDLLLSFGEGFNESPGMQGLFKMIANLTKSLSTISDQAKDIGVRFGDAFGALGMAVGSAAPVAKELFQALKNIVDLAIGLAGVGSTTSKLATDGGAAAKAFQDAHPYLKLLVDGLIDFNTQMQLILKHFNELLSKLKEFEGYLPQNLLQNKKDEAVKALHSGLGLPTSEAKKIVNAGSESLEGSFKASYNPIGAMFDWYKKYQSARAAQHAGFVGPQAPHEQTDEEIVAAGERRKQAIYEAGVGEHASIKSITPPAEDDTNLKNENALTQALARLREAELKLQQSFSKDMLEEQKAYWDESKRLDDEKYAEGLESLKDHLDKQRLIAEADFELKRTELKDNYDAQEEERRGKIADISTRQRRGTITGPVADAERKAIEDQQLTDALKLSTQLTAAKNHLNQQLSLLDRQGAKDRQAARKIEISAELEQERSAAAFRLHIEEERVKSEQQIAQKQLQAGEISPDEFFSQRIAQIERLAEIQIVKADEVAAAQKKAANDTYEAGTKDDATEAQLKKATAKADQDAGQAKLTNIYQQIDALKLLAETETGIRLQATQRTYAPQQQALTEQLSYLQSEGPGQGNAPQMQQVLQQLEESLVRQRNELLLLLNSAKPYSDEWYQIYSQIEKSYQQQVKYNLELMKMRDMMIPIGQGFATIGQAIQANFHSKFAENLGANVSAGAKSLQDSTRLGNIIGGRGAIKDPVMQKLETEAGQLFTNAKSSAQSLLPPFNDLSRAIRAATEYLNKLANPEGAKTLTDKEQNLEDLPLRTAPNINSGTPQASGSGMFQNLADKFTAAISAIDGFTQSILGAKSALGGAAGGATGGAGLGNTLSKAFGMAGPWGAVGGAVLGGVMGAIVGQKNAAVTANIHQFEDDYKGIMNQFALNTNNLQQTIVNLQSLVSQIGAMQQNSKKGSSQYQQLIDQYNQQIIQLEQQQHQILVNLQEQLAIVSAPIGAQSFLGSIQQIIQQFNQFAGAAKSVTDLARAYQFLTESVKDFEANQENQLLQDDTQAINDAIQLNDLLYQRQQMIVQFNNQVAGVLSQGILTRTATRAQTAGQQIEQLQNDYTRQMERLNEEISAAQYKVDAESKIFNLAVTRIGLEYQLLAAQNEQTDFSMQQIAQLQSLVTALKGVPAATLVTAIQSGNYAGLNLPSWLVQLLSSIPGADTSGIGTGTPGSGSGSADDMFAGAYQDRASMGFASYRAQNI